MNKKRLLELNRIFDEQVERLIANENLYKKFLKVSSNIYRYDFKDAVVVQAQRGEVQALAPYDTWKRIGRYVRKGTKGIKIYGNRALRTSTAVVFDLKDTEGINVYETNWKMSQAVRKKYVERYNTKNIKSCTNLVCGDMIKLVFYTQIYGELLKLAPKGISVEAARKFILQSIVFIVSQRTGADTDDLDFSMINQFDKDSFIEMGELVNQISCEILKKVRVENDEIEKQLGISVAEERRDYDADTTLRAEKTEGREGQGDRNNLGRGEGLFHVSNAGRKSDGGGLRTGGADGGGSEEIRRGSHRGGDSDHRRDDQKSTEQMGQNLGELDAGEREREADRLYSGGQSGAEDEIRRRDGIGSDHGADRTDEQEYPGEGMAAEISAYGAERQDSGGNSDSRDTDGAALITADDTELAEEHDFLEDGAENVSSSFLSADSMSLPYIKCEYSESSVFESGKIYTVTEFDRIMKAADTTKHQGWLAGLQEYGSIEAWEAADEESFWEYIGYDKTGFTVYMPDGSKITERQDIGDGFGGVIDFLSQYPQFADKVEILKASMGNDTGAALSSPNDETMLSVEAEKHTEAFNIYDSDMLVNKFGVENGWHVLVYEFMRRGISDTEALKALSDYLPGHSTKKMSDDTGIYNINPCMVGVQYSVDMNSGTHLTGTLHLSQIYTKIKKYLKSGQVTCRHIRSEYILESKALGNHKVPESEVDRILAKYPDKTEKLDFEYDLSMYEREYSGRGAKARFADNIEAIKLLKELESFDRQPSHDEQMVLAKYVGWGGLANAFDVANTEWKKESAELREVLTADEYKAARESVTSAFYTSPEITAEINNIIMKLGINEGKLIEPSMGTGNFLGTLKGNFNVKGVEIDSLTGRIARRLYPNADITINGYEKVRIKDNEYDLAVGNVPFGNYSVVDKTGRYDDKLLIHNYFFAKTLDVVKPGGIIAFITSKGTLDQKNPEFRKYLAQRADLVGAIRLPNTAFKKNAGTEATSDIIILQKRDRLLGDNEIPDWIYTGYTEDGVIVNNYFLDNPQMMLGRMQYSGNFNMTECVADADINIPEEIHSLAEHEFSKESLKYDLPKHEISESSDTIVAEEDDIIEVQAEDTRMYSHVLYDGNIYYRGENGFEKKELSAKDKQILTGLIEIKTLSRKLVKLSMDGAGDEEFNAVRIALNKSYDTFVVNYGYINSKSVQRLLEGDIDKYFLLSLENQEPDGSYSKSGFFEKRTILPDIIIENVDNAQDALRASLSEKGCVDIPYMLRVYKPEMAYEKRKEALFNELRGCIFRNPTKYDGNDEFKGWETADEYLSGNVREKLEIAEEWSLRTEEFKENAEALRKVQPQGLLAEEISVKLGAVWIDVSDYEQFMYELLDIPMYLRRDSYGYGEKMTVDYNKISGEYFIKNKLAVRNRVLLNNTYGTKDKIATELIEDALNQRISTVRCKIDDGSKNGKYIVDQKATLLARAKQDLIKEKFVEWIWKDPERREKYVARYNKEYNNTRLRSYDGSMLNFPGMSKTIKLQKHQVDAVARVLFGGNTLLAHVVGAGKTYEMIAAIMEQKRLGLARKPCMVVPKPLIEQMASDFMKLYPAANILVATEKDFSTKNRKRFIARIATGEFDCVIMSQEQFKKIKISPEREQKLIQDEIDKIDSELVSIKYSGSGRSHTVKALETRKKQLHAKLEKLLADIAVNADQDNMSFEELGIDALYVDEAHAYKNMPITTKMNVSGIASSNSQAALDMLAKCQYINELSNERNVVFATGTPVSNTMGELYVMQTYLQPSALRRAHLDRFDDWAANFGEVVTELEMNVQGSDFRFRNRFSKFVNIPELMNMYKDIADIQTADMLKLPVPEIRGGRAEVVAAERSEIVKLVMDDFCKRADLIQSGGVDPSEDNFLKLTNDARLLGTDVRLLPEYMERYGEYYEDDPGSKLNLVVANIVKEYSQAKDKGIVGTQLVFSDIGTPKTDGRFTVYDFVKKELIAKGIPAGEIAFIHDADKSSDAGKARDQLFDKVRNGEIKVLIGSTGKCGTGVNVQDHCIALHHIDCPWRPSDIEQREGRAIRRGNKNREVAIYRYCTVGTFDAYLWNTVENKQKFISQVMTSRAVTRECGDVDDTTLSYAEIKTIATGNPKVKERMTLENDVNKLDLLKSSYVKNKKMLEEKINIDLPAKINQYSEKLENTRMDAAQAKEHENEDFSMNISGSLVTERKAAAELFDRLRSKHEESDFRNGVFLGSYKGFSVYIKSVFDMAALFNYRKLCAEVRGAGTYTIELGDSAIGNITRIENIVSSLSLKAEKLENKISECKAELEQIKKEYDKPFDREDELVEKRLQLKKLNHELELAVSVDNGMSIPSPKCVKTMNSGNC